MITIATIAIEEPLMELPNTEHPNDDEGHDDKWRLVVHPAHSLPRLMTGFAGLRFHGHEFAATQDVHGIARLRDLAAVDARQPLLPACVQARHVEALPEANM